MVRDINDPAKDMSGFSVSGSQCGEAIDGKTSSDGLVDLKLIRGDAVLSIKKEGYASAMAVVTVDPAGTARSNTVVIVPVFADVPATGSISGAVSIETASSGEEPVPGALVSIEIDPNELMNSIFPGQSGESGKYRPAILSYTSKNLMQPVRTGASGAFQINIPTTGVDLTYTVNVHETELTRNTFCSARRMIVTNGRNNSEVIFRLIPYEK